jgi:hypothetical protein
MPIVPIHVFGWEKGIMKSIVAGYWSAMVPINVTIFDDGSCL